MINQPALTLAALAWRESDHLQACFDSLASLKANTMARTLIVLDDNADDATRTMAVKLADNVATRRFISFSHQRNAALSLADTEWVFFIDPDERCTPPLALEIEKAITSATHSAYRVPRRNILFGREVKHTGWWPDYQVRLMRREDCHYDESIRVHERPLVNGSTGTLSEPLIHYNYTTWSQFATKQKAYAHLEAEALWSAGRRPRPRSLVGQPLRELKRRLVDYRGYKDGALGVALSFAMALYSLEVQRQLLLIRARHRA